MSSTDKLLTWVTSTTSSSSKLSDLSAGLWSRGVDGGDGRLEINGNVSALDQ